MSNNASFWPRVFSRCAWLLLLATALLFLQSAFRAEHAPLSLKAVVALIAIAAAIRPDHALLGIVALIPLSHAAVTRMWKAYPFGLAEALALAFFAGYLVNRRRTFFDARPSADGLNRPAILLAVVVVASALVQFAALQAWHDYPLPYARHVFDFLSTEYLASLRDGRRLVDGLGFLTVASLLVEGVALMLCARTLCRERPDLPRRITNIAIGAGVGAALLSGYQIVDRALSDNLPLRFTMSYQRWSTPAIPSLNTAGSYFMLVAFLGGGTAIASRWRGLLPLLASGLCVWAMLLTRTRAAVVAGLATILAMSAWRAAYRFRLRQSQTLLVASIVAGAAVLLIIFYNPVQILAPRANAALYWRVLFAITAFRMIGDSPLFGVGVGQYQRLSASFAPPELLPFYRQSDAHNNFLWQGAELGVVGLGLVLWLLITAFRLSAKRLFVRPVDYWFLGLFGGLVAYVITWFSWQPLSVPQSGFSFWILLGAAVGCAPEPAVKAARPVLNRLAKAAIAVLVVAVIVSIPLRAAHDRQSVRYPDVTYGLADWNTGADGMTARASGSRATLFVWSGFREIEIPIAARLDGPRAGVDVEIFVDGRPAHRLALRDRNQQLVRLRSPRTSENSWRIDVFVTNAAAPEAVQSGRTARVTGVRIGRIRDLIRVPPVDRTTSDQTDSDTSTTEP